MTSISMRTVAAILAVPAAGVSYAPMAHAGCSPGQVVAVAMSDGRPPSPICVPAGHSLSGHVHATGGNAKVGGSGYKTDPGGPPCDARVPHVLIKLTLKPATLSIPMALQAVTRACR